MSRCSNLSALDKVTTSVLVTNYGLEQFYPGQAVRRCKLLGSPKRLVAFTIADCPEYHDGPTALKRRDQVVFDWFDNIFLAVKGESWCH